MGKWAAYSLQKADCCARHRDAAAIQKYPWCRMEFGNKRIRISLQYNPHTHSLSLCNLTHTWSVSYLYTVGKGTLNSEKRRPLEREKCCGWPLRFGRRKFMLKTAILCIFSLKLICSAVCCDFFERLDDDCLFTLFLRTTTFLGRPCISYKKCIIINHHLAFQHFI